MDIHKNFWVELAGKIGPPIVAATLVACFLESRVDFTHFILLGVGLILIWISHWKEHHS
ncbi:MAG: hypothetical protein ACE5I1_33175 [bacterium]